MKLVIAPDSFKGSLSAARVASAIARGVRAVRPETQILERPMADGGEGTLEAVLGALGGKSARCRQALVRNAAGQSVEVTYALFREGPYEAALIEVARIVGIESAENLAVPVEARSTVGVGELVRLLLDEGIRHFYIGLGGTSTNDGGAGLLAALGVRFTGTFRRSVEPTPAGLARLISVDATGLDRRLSECTIRLLTDVDNPFLGPRGATATFGPQKGVPVGQIERLDAVLENYADRLEAALGRSARHAPGTGAAGGLGYALQLVGGRFESGAATVARLIGLETACAGADWLITGEGRSDAQTLAGKTPYVAAQCFRAVAAAGARATLLSGGLAAEDLPALEMVFDGGCFSITDRPMSLEVALAEAEPLIERTARQLARLRQ
ncbi:MAG: glycerate kinase [Casimicrobiaceae bacterium]|nr:glycerate kinase [Casimicrobiaceae bacterium]